MAKQILSPNPAKIKVVGCGGGGCNAITRMVREGIDGVEFIAINADAQSIVSAMPGLLSRSISRNASMKRQICAANPCSMPGKWPCTMVSSFPRLG